MYINILLGFVIPWILSYPIYRKAPKILLTIFPFGALLSHIVNAIAIEYKIWDILPGEYSSIDFLLFDIGLYTILPSYLIFFIQEYKKLDKIIYILLFTFVTTFLEYVWLKMGRVTYDNGWSIYHTPLSYLIPYILVYMYYKLLKSKNIY